MYIETRQSNTEYAEMLSIEKNKCSNSVDKKKIGQFFTPTSVANLMAKMLVLRDEYKLLDPGSGTGILIAALVDRIIEENINVKLSVDLYENDKEVLPYLEKCMEYCKNNLRKKGMSFEYQVFNEDFILANEFLFGDKFLNNIEPTKYDAVISNPPYFKISKSHKYSKLLHDYVHGQPNIYFMFMIVSEKLIKLGGQIVFITPRSYCSGSYFQRFRSKFFEKIVPDCFHLFKSRNSIFKTERVYQESIILSGFKTEEHSNDIKISSSHSGIVNDDSCLLNVEKKTVMYDLLDKNMNLIRIPMNEEEVRILKVFDKWSNNLSKMDMGISTGPVVTFRNKESIISYNPLDSYPLFYSRHIKDLEIKFPTINEDLSKEKGIIFEATKKLLLPAGNNYIIMKRITTNEQKKRIECAPFIASNYGFKMIGLEDHLNYIYKINRSLTEEEVFGLIAFLNSNIVDRYFRTINGNTQVNAYDIKILPFPEYEFIVTLGSNIISKKTNYQEVDSAILADYF